MMPVLTVCMYLMLDVIVTISWQMWKITIPLIYTVLTSIMVPDGDDSVEV